MKFKEGDLIVPINEELNSENLFKVYKVSSFHLDGALNRPYYRITCPYAKRRNAAYKLLDKSQKFLEKNYKVVKPEVFEVLYSPTPSEVEGA